MTTTIHPLAPRRLLAMAFGLLGAAALSVHAGTTDIASAPLFTTSTTVVKPNVMFVLDDSGSMAWDYMPDNARFGTSAYSSVYGRRAAQCNGLAYDPTKTYALPVDATNTAVANASKDFLSGTYVDSASYLSSGDVYNTSSRNKLTGTTSLSVVSSGSITVTVTSNTVAYYSTNGGMIVSLFGSTVPDWRGRFSYLSSAYMIGKVTAWNSSTNSLTIQILQSVGSGTIDNVYVGVGSPIDNVYYSYSGSQPKLGYVYTTGGVTANTFYNECSATLGSTTGKAVFAANLVLPGSSDAQNYANWYYYYSTRMRMMKTSLTRAFAPLDDKYRIGFMTINDNTSEGILNVRDFGTSGSGTDAIDQKALFYSRINGAYASNSTPLRAALSKAGLYFAKKLSGQSYDPVQYSCQKNFTILSTDGYWNGDAGYQLDGTSAVGQQDGGATTRPMYDGGNTVGTTVETWSETSSWRRTTVTPYTKTDSVTTTKRKPTNTYLTKSYTLGALTANTGLSISNVSRSCSGSYSCTVTVTTSSSHGLSSGDTVVITGMSVSAYNQTVTINRTGSKTFTYVITGTGAAPTTPSGSSAKIAYSPDGCPTGQGLLTRTEATYTTGVLEVKRTDTVWSYSRTVIQDLQTTTPYTRTIITVDGVLSSDVTTPGSPSTVTTPVSTTDSTPTSSIGAPVNGPGNGNAYTTTPVTTGTFTSCASSKPSNTTESTTLAAESSSTSSSTGSYAAGTPEVTNGSATNVVGTKTTTTTTSTSTGGASDSLSDVAMYYYQTDLRDSTLGNCTGALGTSVCDNNVKSLGDDTAQWQHMSTYTLGLGVNGLLKYQADYDTADTGDFKKIKIGDLNWPTPSSDAIANIDDLWHAAVNGRGRYFSATDPTTLAASLSAALNSIKAVVGSSSAAATSTLQPVEGDNGVFIAQFKSSEWTGDLKAYAMNVKTGAVPTSDASGADLATWSASDQLTTSTTRTIYYFKSGSGATGTLREFTYANLTADSQNGLFDDACSKTPALTQCASAGSSLLSSLNSGANMVSFLRGQPQSQYRVRTKVLGDIVNSSPVYVGKPGFSYTENSYATFKSTKATRAPTLYVGANDGMLHAFDASNGNERWAYIPRLVMDKLYRLGDSFYESKHLYYVDATPVVGDVYIGGAWKTILVGGLNAGGAGYYALDVTDPANPVALWEFTDSNMGLSYGNPVITKRKDGKWVVAFTSGYNNSDGQGHLFIVDAADGSKLTDISTGVGTSSDPSGLSKLNAWISADADNTALRFYAGDLLGNIWRFDIDGNLAPVRAALKLGQAIKDGVPQPITTAPQVAEIEANGGKHAVVYVGTGRYLGKTDVSDAQVQSIYAVKDALSDTGLGDLRSSGAALVKQEIDDPSASVRTVQEGHPVDWSTQNGWYLDLPSTRERINVDMQLAFSMLTAAGNIPGNTATDCDKAQDGTSYIYQLSVISGRGTAKKLSSMVAGLSTVQLADGTGVTVVTKTDASAPDPLTVPPSSMANAKARRSSWRELID